MVFGIVETKLQTQTQDSVASNHQVSCRLLFKSKREKNHKQMNEYKVKTTYKQNKIIFGWEVGP